MRLPASIALVFLIIFCQFKQTFTLFDGIKKTLKDAEGFLGNLARGLDFMESVIDDAIEEKCQFECPEGTKLKKNMRHVPRTNGCGSLGLQLSEASLPMPQLRKCCDKHDVCYDTCLEDKEKCDGKFKKCLYGVCDNYQEEKNKFKTCRMGAKMMYTATIALGCKAYKDAQAVACTCQPIKASRREL